MDDFPDDGDSENVDPALFSPSKKSKSTDGSALKPARPQQFILKANGTTHTTPAANYGRAILTPKRLSLSTSAKPVSSAPTVAGRSPQKKRASILSRRRVSASPFTRVDPPSFDAPSAKASNGLPFSIDAALSGTVPSFKRKAEAMPAPAPVPITDTAAALEEHMPKSWIFDIHEDTPDEELGNLMQHSAEVLDLSSDDEDKVREREERGKENVPPEGALAGPWSAAPASRKNVMMDGPRTALGDLDAREFYADGCDANSFVVVPGEADCGETASKSGPHSNETTAAEEQAEEPLHTPCPVDNASANQDVWQNLLAQVNAKSNDAIATVEAGISMTNDDMPVVVPAADAAPSPPPIEIWESESAKDETEDQDQPVVTYTETLEQSLRGVEAAEVEAIERAQ